MLISIDKEFVKENIVWKCIDCHTTCPHSQQKLQTLHIRRTFVAGTDTMSYSRPRKAIRVYQNRRSATDYTSGDSIGEYAGEQAA